MPKIKPKRAARDRFRVTRGGKIMRFKARRNHLLSKRSRKEKRQLSGSFPLSNADAKRIGKLLAG